MAIPRKPPLHPALAALKRSRTSPAAGFKAGPSACEPLDAPSREVKFAGAPLSLIDAEGGFEGYASLFGIVDLGKDMVEAGAFRDSLARRGAAGVKMPLVA